MLAVFLFSDLKSRECVNCLNTHGLVLEYRELLIFYLRGPKSGYVARSRQDEGQAGGRFRHVQRPFHGPLPALSGYTVNFSELPDRYRPGSGRSTVFRRNCGHYSE